MSGKRCIFAAKMRRLLLILVCLGYGFMAQTQGNELSEDRKTVLSTRFLVNTAASMSVSFGLKTLLKEVVNEERPDHSDCKSFPSGHAALAFAGATSLHKEYGKDYPWVSVAGFGAATIIGVERMVSERHHWYDVVAGAGIGIVSTELTWWVSRKLLKNDIVAVGVSGNSIALICDF